MLITGLSAVMLCFLSFDRKGFKLTYPFSVAPSVQILYDDLPTAVSEKSSLRDFVFRFGSAFVCLCLCGVVLTCNTCNQGRREESNRHLGDLPSHILVFPAAFRERTQKHQTKRTPTVSCVAVDESSIMALSYFARKSVTSGAAKSLLQNTGALYNAK